MRRHGAMLIVPLVLVFLIFLAEEGSSGDLDFGGFVKTDKRFNIGGGISNGDTFGRLRAEAKYTPSPDLFSLVSVEVRYYDFPVLEGLPSVGKIESDYPVDVLLWEAYIELTEFILDDLDLKVGKQRIAWGKADTFNPTDNLNPNELTDFLDFEAKVPTLAVKASYYLGDHTITGIWLPLFEPALFPRGGILPILGSVPNRVRLPARTLDNGMFAFKFSGTAFNLDYSFSYFKGYDDIPIPTRMDPSTGLEMGFAEMQVVGLDFAGELRSIGFWGETALFFPEEIRLGRRVVLSDEPYLKYTLGADYTFRNGIYLEAQYVHGFFTERGKDRLNDFLIVKVEKSFLNDDLKFSLVGAIEVKDAEHLEDNYGLSLVPEISYRPMDNLELTMSLYLFGGKGQTLLGRLKDSDQLSLKAEFRF